MNKKIFYFSFLIILLNFGLIDVYAQTTLKCTEWKLKYEEKQINCSTGLYDKAKQNEDDECSGMLNRAEREKCGKYYGGDNLGGVCTPPSDTNTESYRNCSKPIGGSYQRRSIFCEVWTRTCFEVDGKRPVSSVANKNNSTSDKTSTDNSDKTSTDTSESSTPNTDSQTPVKSCDDTYKWMDENTAKERGFSCYTPLEYFEENDNWNQCVFNDSSNKDETLGNSYCEVYCIENLYANMSSVVPSVKAGENFVFPTDTSFIYGNRICKTKSINFDKYINDLNTDNTNVLNSYGEWQLALKLQATVDSFTRNHSYHDCAWSCDEYEDYEVSVTDSDGNVISTYTATRCVSGSYKKHRYGTTQKVSVTTHGKTFTGTASSYCGSGNKPNYNASSKYNTYIMALNKTYGDYEKMKQCYTWSTNDVYYTNPSATLTYKGANGNNYQYSGSLSGYTKYQIDSVDDSTCYSTTVPVARINYSTKDYTIKELQVNKCQKYGMEVSGYTIYEIDDGVYRYVNKANGQSFHKYQLSSFGSSKYFNYIDIGYGNLPVGFATKPGVYGYSTGIGELSIQYSNIGHIYNGTSRIENIINTKSYSKGYYNYNKIYCDYEVTNGLVSQKDSNNEYVDTVIYRTIDLSNPFPGMSGNGRNTGTNWCEDRGYCNNENEKVELYILENRNVEGDEIYNLEPMYSFTLTPSIINRIREYNKDNSYDYDSNGLKTGMVCDKGTGKRCISDYLTQLIEMTNATGTCTQDRKNTFDTCRY